MWKETIAVCFEKKCPDICWTTLVKPRNTSFWRICVIAEFQISQIHVQSFTACANLLGVLGMLLLLLLLFGMVVVVVVVVMVMVMVVMVVLLERYHSMSFPSTA
jgi:hypothetical protein